MALRTGHLFTIAYDHDATRYRYPEDVADKAPAKNGIYMILDGDDNCIYVGKAEEETIRSRLQSHVRGDDAKNARCIDGHSPAKFIFVTEDEISRGTISELESLFIQDYKSDGKAPCNDRR